MNSARRVSRNGIDSFPPTATSQTGLVAGGIAGALDEVAHCDVVARVAIPAILVTSGVGSSGRRREIGILKATGWQTDELLCRGLVESFLLSLAGAALAVVLAFVWLRWLNGYWIAGLFLAGVDTHPGFQVPARLAPVPALLAFLVALVLVMTGTLYSTWRTATVSPREAMR